MISVADTYDVMTARDSYRTPISSFEAIQELRRVSGTQLDARVRRDLHPASSRARTSASATARTPTSTPSWGSTSASTSTRSRLGRDCMPEELRTSTPSEEAARARASATPHRADRQVAAGGAQLLAAAPLGRHDVDVLPGAELEARELGEARHDVDVPVEVLGAAGRGADPEVERRRRAELGAQPLQAFTQQVERRRLGVGEAALRACAARAAARRARARRTGRAARRGRRPRRRARGGAPPPGAGRTAGSRPSCACCAR